MRENYPPWLEAVAWHHYPAQSADRQFCLLTAVHVANVFEHQRTDRKGLKNGPQLDERYLTEVGVSSQLEKWRKFKPDSPGTAASIPQTPYVIRPANTPNTAPKNPWPLRIALGSVAALLLGWLAWRLKHPA